MKFILTMIALLFASPVQAEEESTAKDSKSIDRSLDKKSSVFLPDSLLEAFNEKRLDKGTEAGESDFLLRLTVVRSFHAPLMFTWRMPPDGGESFIEVKRVPRQNSDSGNVSYKKFELWTKTRVSPAQGRLLKKMFDDSTLMKLPQADWSLGSLDGSHWIYEVAVHNDSLLVERSNPISANASEIAELKVATTRIMQESKLNTLGLMLWLISGIDEEPY